MRILLTTIGLLALSGLRAQTNDWFAPVGATWTYYAWTDPPPWVYHQRPYFQAKVVKDSVILGRECRKLQALDADGTLRENSTVWLHVDSNRVYFIEQDTFLLYFDKGLKLGDTLVLHIPDNFQYYDFTCCIADTLSLRVDSVGMVVIDGIVLKRWYFDKWSYYRNHFTEKIGMLPFFGVGPVCCTAGFSGDFHCYGDQTTFINTDTVDCTYPVGIASPEAGSIQIALNPTSGHFEITLPTSFDPASSRALIYSLDGRLIRVADLNTKITNLKLDLPVGLYLVHIQSDKRRLTKRLSVIR